MSEHETIPPPPATPDTEPVSWLTPEQFRDVLVNVVRDELRPIRHALEGVADISAQILTRLDKLEARVANVETRTTSLERMRSHVPLLSLIFATAAMVTAALGYVR